jgi:hypothetical protein
MPQTNPGFFIQGSVTLSSNMQSMDSDCFNALAEYYWGFTSEHVTLHVAEVRRVGDQVTYVLQGQGHTREISVTNQWDTIMTEMNPADPPQPEIDEDKIHKRPFAETANKALDDIGRYVDCSISILTNGEVRRTAADLLDKAKSLFSNVKKKEGK